MKHTYQKSEHNVNFCSSEGDAKYNPCPLLLKPNVRAILKHTLKLTNLSNIIIMYPQWNHKYNIESMYKHLNTLINIVIVIFNSNDPLI